MLWNKARRSDNVNDTREGKDARQPTGKMLGVGLACTALACAGLYLTSGPVSDHPIEDEQLAFIQSVLGDTEDTWTQLFTQTGRQYSPPTLTLFSNGVNSGCGYVDAASGPFYCPDNQQVYLDLEFFTQMAQHLSVTSEFAQAYIIAHEVGHHVQLELGLSAPFEAALAQNQQVTGDGGLAVRAELQADCLAGVWAHHAQQRLNWLEPGDIDTALNAAAAFGDDAMQSHSSSTIRPETFTHGTSAQRAKWFKSGFAAGRIEVCGTFAATDL